MPGEYPLKIPMSIVDPAFIDYVPLILRTPTADSGPHGSLQSFDVCGNISNHLLIRNIYEEQVLNVRE